MAEARLRSGPGAALAARALHARAVTLGRDVLWPPREPEPGTPSTWALLAHEHEHVVDNRGRAQAAPQPWFDPTQSSITRTYTAGLDDQVLEEMILLVRSRLELADDAAERNALTHNLQVLEQEVRERPAPGERVPGTGRPDEFDAVAQDGAATAVRPDEVDAGGGVAVRSPEPEQTPSALTSGADVVSDYTPWVSNAKDAWTAATGVNPVTGERVGVGGRIAAGVFAIPGPGNVAKYGVKGGRLIWKAGVRLFGRSRKRARLPRDVPKKATTATRGTKQWSAHYRSEREARDVARRKVGADAVEVSPGKWRSRNGKWQYRAKPGDVADRHIHLEELDPATGDVLQNVHLRW